jgi:hypothetical protein
MANIIRKVVLAGAVFGFLLSVSGCTLGKNDDQKGSIYSNDHGTSSTDSGSSGNH